MRDEEEKKAIAKLQEAVEEYTKYVNERDDEQYMITEWILVGQGICMDDPTNRIYIHEPSDPQPSLPSMLGMLQYTSLRLHKRVMEEDDDDE